jgi:NAD(P)-dependent dehydrogenase (short-subunit alcohol dehydrogenase family)
MLSLRGKVALVTGSGSIGTGWGNGKAIAVLFARQGAKVMGADIDAGAAEETSSLIEREGNSSVAVSCDVTNRVAVRSLVRDCVDRFGRIDILVNNVGRSEPGGPVEFEEDTWDAQMAVNLKSVFLTCKEVLPVIISSVAGLRYIGKPQVAYSAGKAAMMQFTKTTAVIYAKRGIRLNCVVPGLMFTPLVRRLAEKYASGEFDQFVAHRNKQVPMGSMGEAWDVAHAALFLASDEAKYITGAELVVDGGLTSSTG